MERFFSEIVVNWFAVCGRDLPWRNTREPYKIWLSEVILQQTRVNQGLPYYEAFLNKFPTVFHLARASEQEVLALWQGLGYYSRARNLHAAAQQIVTEYNGQFPNNSAELKKLKGVGAYTAAAIASFCFEEPQPVLDGNVYRLFARFFGLHTPIQTPAAANEFTRLGKKLIGFAQPSAFNQAIMEFGALQCKPQSPDCEKCVLQSRCYAFQNQSVSQLPVKKTKTATRVRHLHYLILQNANGCWVQKRTANDIWKHLYEFPLIEKKQMPEPTDWNKLPHLNNTPISRPKLMNSRPLIHKLTHRELHISFWQAQTVASHDNFISLPKLKELPFPIVLKKLIDNQLIQG